MITKASTLSKFPDSVASGMTSEMGIILWKASLYSAKKLYSYFHFYAETQKKI
jgi:hypothetical protein